MVHIVVSRPAKNASAAFIWSKLAAYSDMSWHPQVTSSKNTGSIEDGSDEMVGAVRVLVNSAGKELTETVTRWSDKDRYYYCTIDKGAPPFAKTMEIGFKVQVESEKEVAVDMIVDLELKAPFCFLAPILKVVLSKKLVGFVDGIANLKEGAAGEEKADEKADK